MAHGRAWIGGGIAGALALLVCVGGCTKHESSAAAFREETYVVRADRLIDEGRNGEALSLLAMAIERNPTLTVAHLRMGEIYQGRGDHQRASTAYERAAGSDPGNFDAQYGHGLMQHLMQKLPTAIRAYLMALTIRPDDFRTNLNLATAYLELDESRKALPFAERAVSADPGSGQARVNLGAIYSALGRHQDAVREYEAASEVMDLSPQLLMNLARSLGKLERYQEMANTLGTVIDRRATAAAHERLGFARFKMRRYAEAKSSFEASLSEDGRYYPALNGMGVTLLNEYIKGGKAEGSVKDGAMEYLRRSLLIHGKQPKIKELVSRFG
jgi:tetratricopeptide (TPR) repeat protein